MPRLSRWRSHGPPVLALAALCTVLTAGTLYSLAYDTSIDTSDPRFAGQLHPLHDAAYFARKTNVLNTRFIKRAWGWTSGAFMLLWATGPAGTRTPVRAARWAAASAAWALFARWFFGAPLGARVALLTGGACAVRLPGGGVVRVPPAHCAPGAGALSPATHPALFAAGALPAPLVLPAGDWRTRARVMQGHDVSGHVFLLTLCTLFLADELRRARARAGAGPAHVWAVRAAGALVGLWLFSALVTSVYFHTPFEKFTGFLAGVAGFVVSQLPGDDVAAEDEVEHAHED